MTVGQIDFPAVYLLWWHDASDDSVGLHFNLVHLYDRLDARKIGESCKAWLVKMVYILPSI